MRYAPAALLLAAACAWSAPAAAHSRGTSYSDWTVDGATAQVRVRVSALELTRLQLDPARTPDYLEQVATRLAGDVQLWSSQGRCAAQAPSAGGGDDGWIAAHWTLRCADARGLTIRSNLFLAVARSHLHFARDSRDGAITERVLTSAQPALALDDAPDAAASFGRYVQLGVEHIWSGWDHLAFVIALILLAGSVREVALVATGFTLAHSLTLACAMLGLVTVGAGATEALIGFSIALVAAENLWLRGGRDPKLPIAFAAMLLAFALPGVTRLPALVPVGLALFTACYFALLRDAVQPLRWRIAIAFLFGLVHGFGFAGALAQMQLPADHLALGLVGFNSGVELGQLAVIALVWPLLMRLRRRPAVQWWARDSMSATICALGTFWFVTRAFA
jgi:hypothetical protein